MKRVQRNLDGYRYRILRDGKIYVVCLSDMNDEEKDRILAKLTKDKLYAMTKGLANRLYQIGEGFNIKLESEKTKWKRLKKLH